jgi:hypothetical protein
MSEESKRTARAKTLAVRLRLLTYPGLDALAL